VLLDVSFENFANNNHEEDLAMLGRGRQSKNGFFHFQCRVNVRLVRRVVRVVLMSVEIKSAPQTPPKPKRQANSD
jgi:hypothetical protein